MTGPDMKKSPDKGVGALGLAAATTSSQCWARFATCLVDDIRRIPLLPKRRKMALHECLSFSWTATQIRVDP